MKISKWPFFVAKIWQTTSTDQQIRKGGSQKNKRKKMEKEVVHLLEWIIEYPGVWQIVCNPDGKETSPESFKMAYDMLVKKSLFYLIPVLFATHPGEESLEMAKNLCTADSAAREIRKNGIGALVKCMREHLE